MKLVLISDVHGNLEALEAVLRDVDRIDPDAKLVCAGDVVGYGPDPEACIARLRERHALCVMGNHEEMVLGYRDFSRCVHAGIVAAVWTREHLSAAARAFLDALPHRREVAAGVVVCHGDLSSAETYVSTREKAEEALAQLRAISSDAVVLVCGHTHQAALFMLDGGFHPVTSPSDHHLARVHPCLINPGAVGQSRDGNSWPVTPFWTSNARPSRFGSCPTTIGRPSASFARRDWSPRSFCCRLEVSGVG